MEEFKSNSRRNFLKSIGIMGSSAVFFPFDSLEAKSSIEKITILHTNDVHSRIDPFPMDGSRNQGLGGVAARAALIQQIRAQEKNVLLLDAGDIFQGTPYFNLYGGELELKLMSKMGYDAATLGNHDFDNGVEGFAKQMHNADFPILCANYDFKNTALEGRTKPYTIFKKGQLRIGVFGIGIELKGLVEPKNYGETIYMEPVVRANKIAEILRNEERCNLVICLSHLGYKYKDKKVSDQILAKETSNIDLIIGGHTHTFMEIPEKLLNAKMQEVQIFQVGFAGINLGRIDYFFELDKKKKTSVASSLIVDGQADEKI